MVGVQAKVRFNGPVYHAANMVCAAVDAMATLLIGDPQHLWAQGSSMTDQQRQREVERAVRETEKKPWAP
jgi:hypothetical protein